MHDPGNQKPTYFYSASAMALGGRITRPFDANIDTQASSVLPIVGGMGTARVQDFRFREIVSFQNAYSVVTGSQSKDDGSFATLAMVTIEDLNILHMLTAKKIVSRLAANAPSDPKQQATIISVGSQLTGLNVAGCDLAVEFDVEPFCSPDMNKAKAYEAARKRPGARVSNGTVVTSLVSKITATGSCSGVRIAGNQIDVPHFGRIYVGQFLLTPYSWRLVMLRVELGCSAEGVIASGCTQGNGTT